MSKVAIGSNRCALLWSIIRTAAGWTEGVRSLATREGRRKTVLINQYDDCR